MLIAKVKVEISHYMVDDPEFVEKLHLVEADDEHEARSKIRAYYDEKDDPYSVSYFVTEIEFGETIK